jgi:hypothetical protein
VAAQSDKTIIKIAMTMVWSPPKVSGNLFTRLVCLAAIVVDVGAVVWLAGSVQ